MQEMRLLAELDQPTRSVSRYANELSLILVRKAAGNAELQSKLATHRQHIEEQAQSGNANGNSTS